MRKINNNKNRIKNFTRGGQIAFHNIRMWFQVNQTLFKICKYCWLILTVGLTWLITPKQYYLAAWYWCQAQVYPILKLLDIKLPVFKVLYHNKFFRVSPEDFLRIPGFVKSAHTFLYYAAAAAITSLIILGVFIFYLLGKYLIKKGEEQTANKFIRGSQLDNAANVAKQIKKRKAASDIVIDDLPMLAGSEIMHFLVHGATGTGKTQLISKFLDHLRRRGDKVVVYDMGGVYTSTFYRKGQDKILNPLDARSENWELWCEAREAPDFFNLATSLIPRPHYGDPYWPDAARSVFANAAFNMQEDDRSIKKLLELLLTEPLEELYRYLADTEAAALMTEKIEKTALTVRSVIATYVKALKFLTAIEHTKKPKFSIQNWLNNKNKQDDWLFLTSIAEHHESLKPLLSMWFSMASICLMQSSLSRSKRVWIICDELPSMHQQPQLAAAMAQSRKYGGCFILGMQNYAQLETIYGNEAKDIFDNMHTRFFFRSPSSNIAELVSRELGSQEVENVQETYSYGANTIRDGITLSSQRVMHQIVTPAEIMDLEKMNCYVRLAGTYPVAHLSLEYQERTAIEKEFIPGNITPDPKVNQLTDTIGCQVREIPKKSKTITEQPEETKIESQSLQPEKQKEQNKQTENTPENYKSSKAREIVLNKQNNSSTKSNTVFYNTSPSKIKTKEELESEIILTGTETKQK